MSCANGFVNCECNKIIPRSKYFAERVIQLPRGHAKGISTGSITNSRASPQLLYLPSQAATILRQPNVAP